MERQSSIVWPDRELAAERDRPLLYRAHGEDGALVPVKDGREGAHAEHAEVGYGEGPVGELLGLEPAGPRGLAEPQDLVVDRREGLGARVLDHGHYEARLGRSRETHIGRRRGLRSPPPAKLALSIG